MEVADGTALDLAKYWHGSYRVEIAAASLSKTCRFNGHCTRFYSVAEHAVLVARMMFEQFVSCKVEYVPRLGGFGSEEYALLGAMDGLHHDDAEQYIGDIISPYKTQQNRDDEAYLMRHIRRALGLEGRPSGYVELFDRLALAIEARDVMKSGGSWWASVRDDLPDPPPRSLVDIRTNVYGDPGYAEMEYLGYHRMLEDKIAVLREEAK